MLLFRDIKENCRKVRSIIPGLPEEFYLFVEHLSNSLDDSFYSRDICDCIRENINYLTTILPLTPSDDLKPEEVAKREIMLFPDFIGQCYSVGHYNEFLKQFNSFFNEKHEKYPSLLFNAASLRFNTGSSSIKAALAWWGNAIQCVYYHNDVTKPYFFDNYKDYLELSEEDFNLFIALLLNQIKLYIASLSSDPTEDDCQNAIITISTNVMSEGIISKVISDFNAFRSNVKLCIPRGVTMLITSDSITINNQIVWQNGQWILSCNNEMKRELTTVT